MKSQRRLGLLGLVLAVVAIGCGSSSSGGSSADTVASCNAFCAASIAKNCSTPNYTSIDDCKTSECGNLASAPAKCQTPLKALYDCRAAQADICADAACTSEMAAVNSCA